MYFKITWAQDFADLMHHLWGKYGREIFTENGIGDQLDLNKFSQNFFNNKTTTADISIDANANVCGKSVIDYAFEFPKPLQKYNSHYLMWKSLKASYGLQVANEIMEKQISGEIYINDFSDIGKPYCFNFSTYDIALEGLSMSNRMTISAPKSLESFMRQMEQFTVYAANSTLGATGLADILIVASHYVDKIIETGYDGNIMVDSEPDGFFGGQIETFVSERFRSFIYTLNWEFRGNQSPFTNLSVYDDHFLTSLTCDYQFLGFGSPNIGTVKMVQEIFVEAMNDELKRSALTFPVVTACFYTKGGKVQDKVFQRYIAEQNIEFGFINMYYGDSSTLSSCCFRGDQETLTKSSDGVNFMTFEDLQNAPYKDTKRNFTIFHNGSWQAGRLVELDRSEKKLYRITTANKKITIVTEDHLNPTIDGDIPTKDLTVGEYLAFSNRPLDSFPEKCDKLTYEQGYVIGAYLGDGSKYKRKDYNSCEVTFSLGSKDKKDVKTIKKGIREWGILSNINTYDTENNVHFVKINSVALYEIIEQWVEGNYSYEKSLNMDCLLQSLEFRHGILDGWYMTDGGNSNRIYSTSSRLIDCGEALLTSIGRNSVINVSDRTGENKVQIRGESFNRNYPLYCLRWYDMKNKRSMKDIYRVQNNTEYFMISKIQEMIPGVEDEKVYCFEMSNDDEPYFTLPNGMITHNCRLRSSTDNEYFNSFGAGSTKIGSLGVVTSNLPRLACIAIKEENPDEVFMELVQSSVEVVARVNNAKRNIIKKRIDLGAMPLYTSGHMNLSKQYSTYGVTGLNEALQVLGYSIVSDGGESFVIELLDLINEENDKMAKRFHAPHNCEQVPAESSAVKLAKRDRSLKYQSEFMLYSNQFIPLTTEADMLDRMRLQGVFDEKFSGGAICHINIGEKIKDVDTLITLMDYAASAGVVYWAVNYAIKRCEDNHVFIDGETCPVCGKPVDTVITRVVGFFTNVANWNETRREHDWKHRQFYKEGID